LPHAPAIRSFRDIVAWRRAYDLGRSVIPLCRLLPRDERFALAAQIRRCAVSIPSNIAEGYGRGSRTDYARFLKMARGSLYELDTQLMLRRDLGYFGADRYDPIKHLLDETERVLAALIRSIERPRPSP
jgi:four helix bundle protein